MAYERDALTSPLAGTEVHVWAAKLERNSHAERRTVLREILSGYVGCETRRIQLRRAAGGKPQLVQDAGGPLLELSWSSSAELVLYAIARGRRVGVDVERVRAVCDPVELARSVLGDHDRSAIAHMPEGRRHRAFLGRWTQTEACLKARGTGLAALGEPAPVEETWSVRPLALGSEYVGAVAAEGVGWTMRVHRW
jgi:4'-phosphopantetheinyl transferase